MFVLEWQVCEYVLFGVGVCWYGPWTQAFRGGLFLVTRSFISELHRRTGLVDLVSCGWPNDFQNWLRVRGYGYDMDSLNYIRGPYPCNGKEFRFCLRQDSPYTTTNTVEKIPECLYVYILMAPHPVSVTGRLRPPSCLASTRSHPAPSNILKTSFFFGKIGLLCGLPGDQRSTVIAEAFRKWK